MRDLAIAYGNNRQAKKWVNKTISYTDLKEHLKVTIRTTESAEEYARWVKHKGTLQKTTVVLLEAFWPAVAEKLIRLSSDP